MTVAPDDDVRQDQCLHDRVHGRRPRRGHRRRSEARPRDDSRCSAARRRSPIARPRGRHQMNQVAATVIPYRPTRSSQATMSRVKRS